ncbi:uncharacterized protein LOC122258927 [Penaeus japonicus]|uniref:uncharacterized protein LOC122258927 n=1 Tax=Penaeus japonicus TaxID=27405 RepID=UPI001C715630|nr:uncharacterized protein LOC122258927 [Penaeus japonicus]
MVVVAASEELEAPHPKRNPTWYPRQSWPVLWLGILLGVSPWGRSGRWTPGNALYAGASSLIMILAFISAYCEYHRHAHYPIGNTSWLCEMVASAVSLSVCLLTQQWFWWRRLVRFSKPFYMFFFILFLEYIAQVNVMFTKKDKRKNVLETHRLTRRRCRPQFVFPLTLWYHCLTAAFPILLYVSLADLLAQHATALNASLGRAVNGDCDSLVAKDGGNGSMASTEVIEETVVGVAREWRHLNHLHQCLEKVLSVPLLASAADMCVRLVASAFFLSELDSVYHTVAAGIMIVSCISFLHVQGHVTDCLQQQTQAVHSGVRKYLASKRLPPTGTLDHLLVTEVAQLAEEAGKPLEISLVGLYTLSRSNFLPAVGASVAHVVILLQFYLANVSSSRHSLQDNSTDYSA